MENSNWLYEEAKRARSRMAARGVYPSQDPAKILLNGRNFEWAVEMTGMPREHLEVLYLEAKFKDVVCVVSTNLDREM